MPRSNNQIQRLSDVYALDTTTSNYEIPRKPRSVTFEASPVSSPDLYFSHTGKVVKHRHTERKLRKTCQPSDICSECPLAENCIDSSMKLAGTLEKELENSEVFEWQRDWVELLRANILNNVSHTKETINETFDNMIKVLEKRRKELIRKADIEGKKRLSLLKFRNANVHEYVDNSSPIEDMPSNIPEQLLRTHGHVTRTRSVGDDESEVGSPTTIASVNGLRVLRVGNLHFTHEKDVVSLISKFGDIRENLASALHSEAVGLGLYYGLANEPAKFRVVTRNTSMQTSFVEDDLLKVYVIGPDGCKEKADIEMNENAVHAVSFKPLEAGCHDIRVFVNNLELPESPFCCHVYQKEKLTFDQEPIEAYGYHVDATSQGAWAVQKEGCTALLTKSGAAGALIHAVQMFSEHRHAWKVKVISACPMVRVCLGVSTRTNIFDVDIEHTCDFNLGITKYGPAVDRRMSRRPKRRSSIYMRESRTFMVLLDLKNKRITIVCCETEEGKHLSIPGGLDVVYPCVFMTHECRNEACPRPVVTFM